MKKHNITRSGILGNCGRIIAALFLALCVLTSCGVGTDLPDDSDLPETIVTMPAAGTISFEINAKNAVDYGMDGLPEGGVILGMSEFELRQGDSVMDILMRVCPESVENRGGYVPRIGNLRERDCGASSGWYYFVNGEAPMMSAVKYIPADGDVIRFLYTVRTGDIPY